jgi:capsular polysaccharide export protein
VAPSPRTDIADDGVKNISGATVGCISLRLSRMHYLSYFLNAKPRWLPFGLLLTSVTVIVGWGRKRQGLAAQGMAARKGLPFLCIEDGFLRSIKRDDPPLSLIVDDEGIYYDESTPSQLERLIPQPLDAEQSTLIRMLVKAWCTGSVSKYNGMLEYEGDLGSPYVLVIDQTLGDASISYGRGDTGSFLRMLSTALIEYPSHTIILKTHPDVATHGKKGHFDLAALKTNRKIWVISDPVHPVRLLKHAEVVYTVTSQLGFEALIWGKPVRCFGMPFYAGWGLTDDDLPAPDRRKTVSLEQLMHAALVKYPRYIDPVTMQRCEPTRAFEYVGLQRRKRLEFPPNITAIGFSRWKRPFITRFLLGSEVSFTKRLNVIPQVDPATAVAVWGSSGAPLIKGGTQPLRIEDGFLRSSGLGADLVRPLSLVIDDIGIYYDATRPSRLERILQTQELNAAALRRACDLRKKIVQLDVTKYNLGKQPWSRPGTCSLVLLVVGQVETDASIRLGSPDLKSNSELLRRVRRENPSAYIVYKPHPDVLAGLRRLGEDEDVSHDFADEILSSPVSLGQLLVQVDEVHTMTSLMGYEALIRGVKVVCHGLPFYAGWGLTEDRLVCERRTRQLTIDELVYGTLISYPRYFSYERNCFIEPEHAIDQLAGWAKSGPTSRTWPRKILRAGIVAWLKLKGSTR